MTEELISALYPPPPAFYKYFTKENVEKYKEWVEAEAIETTETTETTGVTTETTEVTNETKEASNETTAANTETTEAKLDVSSPEKSTAKVPPGELKFLSPPIPPSGTHYRGYGNIWSFEDKLPSLKSSNWQQLYNDDDEQITSETKIKELHKLMDSLLLNFLELISIISINPNLFESKVKDISLILININHLLNTYRPHQLRESLIMLLKKQIEMKQLEIGQIDSVTREITEKILKLAV